MLRITAALLLVLVCTPASAQVSERDNFGFTDGNVFHPEAFMMNEHGRCGGFYLMQVQFLEKLNLNPKRATMETRALQERSQKLAEEHWDHMFKFIGMIGEDHKKKLRIMQKAEDAGVYGKFFQVTVLQSQQAMAKARQKFEDYCAALPSAAEYQRK